MPTTSSPVWSAAQAGLIGNAGATAASAQVNQLLTTHPDSLVYAGAPVSPAPRGHSNHFQSVWTAPLATLDIDQPFTLTGTTIGRVTVPILPVGNGADLLVSLCDDNSGAPGTVIAQTRIPANWITTLSPVAGISQPSTQAPVTVYTNNTLVSAQFYGFTAGAPAHVNYPTPAVTGIAAAASTAYYYPYIVQIGGVNNDVALNSVFTIPYSSTGTLGTSIPQPAFPEANDGSSGTTVVFDTQANGPVIVNVGGGTSFLGAPVANVYTASLDTSTGAVSAWSAQTALPADIQIPAMAANGSWVYVIGGKSQVGDYANDTVYYAQVQNGQIQAWSTATPLPQGTTLSYAAVCSGLLFVWGGTTAGGTTLTDTWCALVNPDGSLGQWFAADALPYECSNFNCNTFSNDYGIICVGGTDSTEFLPVNANGPGSWIGGNYAEGAYSGFYDNGDGTVTGTGILGTTTPAEVTYYTVYLTPLVSVPLPITGLTGGGTYHVLLQQVGGDLGDYLVLGMGQTEGLAGQSSPKGAYTWTQWPYTSLLEGCMVAVYDGSVPAAATLPLHTWQDGGSRISTFVSATTPDQRLLGLCEATRMGLALNANQGFETGISPWTWSGGTAVQSTTRSYSGLHSIQVTPNGTSASCSISSEIMPCMPVQAVTAAGWFWFTNSVSSEFSLSVEWYTAVTGGTSISTTTTLVSASAATWTETVNNLTAVGGAYGFQMVATLSGTPAAGQVWYGDWIIASYTYTGEQQSTVTEINYGGSWPSYQTWPPLGTTVLA